MLIHIDKYKDRGLICTALMTTFILIKALFEEKCLKNKSHFKDKSSEDLPLELTTSRLKLRPFNAGDGDYLAALTSDPKVMAHFPSLLSRIESDAMLGKIMTLFNEQGWGIFAVEERQTAQFVGLVGLVEVNEAGFPRQPFIELTWRLHADFWGKGYAPEAAQVCIEYVFNTLDREEIYAYTSLGNTNSRRVMEKLGLVDLEEDFPHPRLSRCHPLSMHCLYQRKR